MKSGVKRGSGYGSGYDGGAAVLDAPEERYASAPAGALRGGYGDEDFDEGYVEPARTRKYVSKREGFRLRMPGVPESTWGKVLTGVGGVLGLGAVVGGAMGLRQYLLHDERFVVTTSADIQMAGNKHLTRQQVLSVFGADLERNIFRMPMGERKADLERLPWVEHATVMRLLPNQIRVAVTERTPVAFVRNGSQIGLVDANGVLLDLPMDAAGDPHYSFPVLTGLAESDPLSTRKARMEIYRRFMAELEADKGKLTESISEVDVSNPEDVKAIVATGGTDVMVHFGDEDFLERYKTFQEHVAEWKQTYPKLVSADMRYQDQIVLDAGAPLSGAAVAGGSGTGSDGKSVAGAASPADLSTASSQPPRSGKKRPTGTPVSADAGRDDKLVGANSAAGAGGGAAPAMALKVAPKAVAKPAVAKPAAKPVARHAAAVDGASAANQRMFAILAAEHKAELAKAAAARSADGSAGR